MSASAQNPYKTATIGVLRTSSLFFFLSFDSHKNIHLNRVNASVSKDMFLRTELLIKYAEEESSR
jgi:hypothetical protein